MGKYDGLRQRLLKLTTDEWRPTFAEVEQIVGFALPPSARSHAAWWANNRDHSHSSAWLDAGWQTEDLSLTAEQITFRRTGKRHDGPRNAERDIPNRVEFRVEQGDITEFEADLVALKFAQSFHGADRTVARILRNETSITDAQLRPLPGDFALCPTNGNLAAPFALFVGVKPLFQLRYEDIRDLGYRTIELIAAQCPHAEHVAITVHGPGFGLDELESVKAQTTGILEGLAACDLPNLRCITWVELDGRRANRIRDAIGSPGGTPWHLLAGGRTAAVHRLTEPRELADGTRRGSPYGEKPHIFVAMPFAKEFEDVFEFGILAPAHECGLLCERIDQASFTGDVIEQIKRRIETAQAVVADLSGDNPNVFLEVGFAWGRNRPTILLQKKGQTLRFDVQGQRCLIYETIKDLKSKLSAELAALKTNGGI